MKYGMQYNMTFPCSAFADVAAEISAVVHCQDIAGELREAIGTSFAFWKEFQHADTGLSYHIRINYVARIFPGDIVSDTIIACLGEEAAGFMLGNENNVIQRQDTFMINGSKKWFFPNGHRMTADVIIAGLSALLGKMPVNAGAPAGKVRLYWGKGKGKGSPDNIFVETAMEHTSTGTTVWLSAAQKKEGYDKVLDSWIKD